MELKTIGPDELAKILHRSVETVKVDCRRRPETLPPRLKIPGSKKLVWLQTDVETWINSLRPEVRLGRRK